MKTFFISSVIRFTFILASVLTLGASWSCIERPMKVPDPSPRVIPDFSMNLNGTRDVDIVFLIDTSLSMEYEQQLLRANFANLVRVLENISGGLPNIHLGTITPDLGTAPYDVPGCSITGGDNARFLKGYQNACVNPRGQNFVVDVEPRGCSIQKNIVDGQPTTCASHDCTQANCEPDAFSSPGSASTEPAGLQLAVDAHGCPRCRNYEGESLEQVFSCMADLGINGCGFEQQLESLMRAVSDPSGPNAGFLRPNAYLALFLITDEDDCSARSAELYTRDENGPLGPLENFRCLEYGVKCDQAWQRIMTSEELVYTGCAPRENNDPLNLLHPISRYTAYFKQIKDSGMVLAGAIAGPYAGQVRVGINLRRHADVLPSCGETDRGAAPAVRINAFVESLLETPADMDWALTSICNPDYSPALVGLGQRIKNLVEARCITTPLAGCPDPAAANGLDPLTKLDPQVASVCEPQCSVQEINPDGSVHDILQCPPDYRGGHPEQRDAQLPVAACFHVTYDKNCAQPCPTGSEIFGCNSVSNPWYGPSRGAQIVLSRRKDPPTGSRAKITCAGLPLTEKICTDGVDNDVDGLVDANDPDCNQQP